MKWMKLYNFYRTNLNNFLSFFFFTFNIFSDLFLICIVFCLTHYLMHSKSSAIIHSTSLVVSVVLHILAVSVQL